MNRKLCSLAVALLIISGVHVEAQGLYRKDQYTVKDLLWCLSLNLPPIDSECMEYILGITDLVRVGEVRFKGKPICLPQREPMTRRRVFDIVMKHERLEKWDPGAPAAAFIATTLAERLPCNK